MSKILAHGGYEVVVDCESTHLVEWLADRTYSSITVLVDEHTKEHCLEKLLKTDLTLSTIEIPSGESFKKIETITDIAGQLQEQKVDRRGLVINLGGGVIGDMGGFAAGIYKRGIDFIQMPTSLLAMVDASVGGKTGVNFNGIKNQLGLFNQPSFVWINPEFLATLPKRHLYNGLAELIKHCLLDGRVDLITKIPEWMSTAEGLIEMITYAVSFKNKVVSMDYLEAGPRQQLNFGHTIGHALESYSLKNDEDPLYHGEAVASGMLIEWH